MKLNLFALVTLLGCANNAALALTCSESSALCVCSGDCPSFTNDWARRSSDIINGESTCVATNAGGIDTINNNGVLTVNGQTYTNVDPCTSAIADGSSAGMFGAYASTCSESSGLCVCSGDCPSFTNGWGSQSTVGGIVCATTKAGGVNTSMNNGVLTVNGQTYTNVDPCTSAIADGSSAGMFGAYYDASVLVTAAAVIGGVAAI